MEDQPAAHDGIPVPVLPEEERIWHKIVAEPYLVGVGPVKIGHEGLAQLVADATVSDGGLQVLPIAGEYEARAVPARAQRYGFELLGAIRLAAGDEELPEPGPAQIDGLLRTLHTVDTVAGQPGEVKGNSVVLLVEPDLHKRADVRADNPPLILETVELAVADVKVLGRLHVGADGSDVDGAFICMGAEHDSIGHYRLSSFPIKFKHKNGGRV